MQQQNAPVHQGPSLTPESIRPSHKWRRSAQLGVALVILGILVIATAWSATTAQVTLSGWLLMVSGIVEIVHALHVHRSSNFFLHVVPGIAGVPIGLLMITRPEAGAPVWTAVFTSFFFFIGCFRALSAWRLKFPNWGWTVFEGAATLLLGIFLWTAWPWAEPRFFGIAVGTSLVLRGLSYAMFALALRGSRSSTPARLRAA